MRSAEGYDGFRETTFKLDKRPAYNDPFSILAAIVKKEITLAPYDLNSLENNMMVMNILEAAKLSARTKKTVKLK